MKNFSWSFVVCLFVCLFMLIAVPAWAQEGAAETVSMEDLMNMGEQERDVVLNAIDKIKKQKAEQAESDIIESVVTMAPEDLEAYKTKALAIAEAVVAFCDKIGVSANEFIKSPAGNIAIVGVVYKMGVFGSLWSVAKGSVFLIILVVLLWLFNTKKKVQLVYETKDGDDKITATNTEEILKPRFTPIYDGDEEVMSVVAIVATIIIFVAICVTVINM